MQKKLFLALAMVVVLGFRAEPASAWMFTQGDTGWQTYSYTAGPSGFTGTAGFVVSCQGVLNLDSYLFLDNLSQCGQANNVGFETGGYGGFNPLSGGLEGVITGTADGHLPKTGTYMSALLSQSSNTSGFHNFYGTPGTQGSILETQISLTPGQQFTFDWDFLAGNPNDFSLFYLRDSTGIIIEEGLGQQVPIPVPNAALLFGSGLMGLVGWRRFRKS